MGKETTQDVLLVPSDVPPVTNPNGGYVPTKKPGSSNEDEAETNDNKQGEAKTKAEENESCKLFFFIDLNFTNLWSCQFRDRHFFFQVVSTIFQVSLK